MSLPDKNGISRLPADRELGRAIQAFLRGLGEGGVRIGDYEEHWYDKPKRYPADELTFQEPIHKAFLLIFRATI
jgi:hypothetical protein